MRHDWEEIGSYELASWSFDGGSIVDYRCRRCGLVFVLWRHPEDRYKSFNNDPDYWYGECPGKHEPPIVEWTDFYTHNHNIHLERRHHPDGWQQRLGGIVAVSFRGKVDDFQPPLWPKYSSAGYSYVTRQAIEEKYGDVQAFLLHANGDVYIWTDMWTIHVSTMKDGADTWEALPISPMVFLDSVGRK